MALINCPECGKQISSKADSCPACGVRSPRMKVLTRVILMSIGFLALFAIIRELRSDSSEEKKVERASQAARFAAAKAAGEHVKAAVREPDALKFESVRVNDAANVVCIKYRTKNRFGGINDEQIVFRNDRSVSSITEWNTHCLGLMHDELHAVN